MRSMKSMLVMTFILGILMSPVLALGEYKEAPILAEMVAKGELPPVEERLPANPVVVEAESIGKYGGTLNVGLSGHLTWFGDGQSALGPSHLLRISSDYKGLVPNLIRSWEWSEDGTTWTTHLIEGAKWSDGAPFTADDVMFWYEDILLNEELTPTIAPRWKPGGEVMKLSKVGPYSVEYKFAVPYPTIMFLYSHYQGAQGGSFAPGHYLKQFHAKYQEKETLENMVKEEGFDEWVQLFEAKNRVSSTIPSAIGTPSMSPYVVEISTPEYHLLKRNPYFWKVDTAGNQLPYIDEVKMGVYADSEVLTLKAVQGEFDIFGQNSNLQDYPVYMENKEKGGYDVVRALESGANQIVVQFNLDAKDEVKREIFQNKNFRIAVSHAINRDEINETQYFGLCEPMANTAHFLSPYYKEEYGKAYIEYDIDKANTMLDEIGLEKRDAEGYRLLPDGRRFAVTFESPPDARPWTVPVTELLVDYMKGIGIEMSVKADNRDLYAQRVYANDVEMNEWNGVAFTNTMVIDPRVFVPFRTGDETIWYGSWASWYVTGGKEGNEPIPIVKELLALYEKMVATIDDAERNAIVDEILKIHAENVFGIGTVGKIMKPLLISNRLRNVPKENLVHGYDTIRLVPNNPETFYFEE